MKLKVPLDILHNKQANLCGVVNEHRFYFFNQKFTDLAEKWKLERERERERERD